MQNTQSLIIMFASFCFACRGQRIKRSPPDLCRPRDIMYEVYSKRTFHEPPQNGGWPFTDFLNILREVQEQVETLTKQWPGKWCRQGAFVLGDKAGDARTGRERETDRARGQGNVVESPQGLLGKCSWMTALWNVHKWRVLIGQRPRLV